MPAVEISVNGEAVLFQLNAAMLLDSDEERRMQVVFHDITAERRRSDLVENFAAHVVLGQEEERRRISQDLHDGPLQSLVHLCRRIDTLEAGSSDSQFHTTQALRKEVEQTVDEIRDIARGLRPSILDDLGLVASVGQLLIDAKRRQGFETSIGITGAERRLPPEIELALFRIAQEALNNIERHAAAHTVAVGLDFEGGLRLLVKDDGIGFDPMCGRRGPPTQSLGITGMAKRANLIGADWQVRSRPGSGTTIDVRLSSAIIARNH